MRDPAPLANLMAPDWAQALNDVEPSIRQAGDFLRQLLEPFLRQRVGEPEGDELQQPELVAMRQITPRIPSE